MINHFLITVLAVAVAVILVVPVVKCEGQLQACLHQKRLVKVDIIASEILSNHQITCDENIKYFPNTLLGYVTPWNPLGKTIAKKYASKIDLLAPVWHNLDLADNKYYQVTGEENYDSNFIDEVKKVNPKIKIVPRVNLEKKAMGRYYQLGGKGEAERISELILKYCQYFFETQMKIQNQTTNTPKKGIENMTEWCLRPALISTIQL